MHELGHTVGFHHEQVRPDRDDYVSIRLENVRPDQQFNFEQRSTSEIDDHRVPYDYLSVMHYGPTVSSVTDACLAIMRRD